MLIIHVEAHGGKKESTKEGKKQRVNINVTGEEQRADR